MIFERLLTPDYLFGSYREITPDFLEEQNLAFLLIDIDNTLAPYETAEPEEETKAWFAALAAAGIRAALISNNHPDRVLRYNAPLSLPAYPDAGKPRGTFYREAMTVLGAERERTAVLGDQLLTDVLAGKRLGLRAILVPPIRDKKTLFFRVKRAMEIPYLKAAVRQHPEPLPEAFEKWRKKPHA